MTTDVRRSVCLGAWVPGQPSQAVECWVQNQKSRADFKRGFAESYFPEDHVLPTSCSYICLGVIKQIGLLRVVPLQKYP